MESILGCATRTKLIMDGKFSKSSLTLFEDLLQLLPEVFTRAKGLGYLEKKFGLWVQK